jgi:hypothetical protein
MAYDAASQEVVLFGGYSLHLGDLGDTWSWNGTNWTELHASAFHHRVQ